MAKNKSFDDILNATLEWEGGYTVDHAGKTNYGITQDTFNSYNNKYGMPLKDVKEITLDEAKDIYKNQYYTGPGYDKLPHKVSGALFDYGVNSGTNKATKDLQKIIGVNSDGIIGNKTIKAINDYIDKNKEDVLVEEIFNKRKEFIDNLVKKNPKKYEKYYKGWINRIEDIKNKLEIIPNKQSSNILSDFFMGEAAAQDTNVRDLGKWKEYVVQENIGVPRDLGKWKEYVVQENIGVPNKFIKELQSRSPTTGEIVNPPSAYRPKNIGVPNKFIKELQSRSPTTGEIVNPPSAYRPKMAGIGQFLGGIAGTVGGTKIGHPYLGGILGGTVGRVKGVLEGEQLQHLSKHPITGGIEKILTAPFPGVSDMLSFQRLSPSEQERLIGNVPVTAATETIGALLGLGGTKLATKLFTGTAETLLGKKIVEQGQTAGWKTLLNPEYYKKRIPKQIAQKASKFYDKLDEVTGNAISNLFQNKYSQSMIQINPIKVAVRRALPESGNPADLLEMTAPKMQKDFIKRITKSLLGLKRDFEKATTVWESRRELDKSIFGRTWTIEAKKYLLNVRTALNTPLRNLGDDMAKAFDNYNFVQQTFNELGSKFDVIKRRTGEIYAMDLEKFLSTFISDNKTETIALLKQMDDFLKTPDKTINEIINYSSAKKIDGTVPGLSFSSFITNMFKLKKNIARLGAFGQKPIFQGTKKFPLGLNRLGGKALVTQATDLIEEE